MTRLTIGIVDYGVGNHASVRTSLLRLGVRCRISDDPIVLAASDLLVLPGVGAYAPAMEALRRKGLDQFLMEQAARHQPLIGVCLGMQLLAQASHEHGYHRGLGLIPGEIVSVRGANPWHIGWNTIEVVKDDPLFRPSSGDAFYFNHSFLFDGPPEFVVAYASQHQLIPAAVRRGKTVGMQFHPEKSQSAGASLLRRIVDGLACA